MWYSWVNSHLARAEHQTCFSTTNRRIQLHFINFKCSNFPYKSNHLHHKTFIFTSGNFPNKRREGNFGSMISGISWSPCRPTPRSVSRSRSRPPKPNESRSKVSTYDLNICILYKYIYIYKYLYLYIYINLKIYMYNIHIYIYISIYR